MNHWISKHLSDPQKIFEHKNNPSVKHAAFELLVNMLQDAGHTFKFEPKKTMCEKWATLLLEEDYNYTDYRKAIREATIKLDSFPSYKQIIELLNAARSSRMSLEDSKPKRPCKDIGEDLLSVRSYARKLFVSKYGEEEFSKMVTYFRRHALNGVSDDLGVSFTPLIEGCILKYVKDTRSRDIQHITKVYLEKTS